MAEENPKALVPMMVNGDWLYIDCGIVRLSKVDTVICTYPTDDKFRIELTLINGGVQSTMTSTHSQIHYDARESIRHLYDLITRNE
jgi:hypothetical protein